MKKVISTLFFLSVFFVGFSQVDTISTNIYQKNGNLGIGTNNPDVKLRIEGNITGASDGRTLLRLRNTASDIHTSVSIGLESNDKSTGTAIGHTSSSYRAIPDFNDMGVISTNGKGFSIYSSSDSGSIRFYTNRNTNGIIERMRITAQGKLGIGTKDPVTLFDVNGGIKIGNTADQYAGMLRWTGNDFEGYNGSSWLSLTNTSDTWQLNNNDIFFDQGKVGIGTNSPTSALSIEGDETEWPGRMLLSVYNRSTGPKSLAYMEVKAGGSGNHTVLGHISETYEANDSSQDLQDFGMLSSSGNGLIINATKNDQSPGIIKFTSGQSTGNAFDERMRIDAKGNIGIGTKDPKAKLEIADGDIYISDINKGIIMKSPDGQCWRGVLDNNGTLNFSQIDCPGVNVTSSMEEKISTTGNISIFPNPVENAVTIQNESNLKKMSYRILNLNGQVVKSGNIRSNNMIVDISSLNTGMYVMNVLDKTGNKLVSEKLIKK